ncbi:MAG TPA: class I adenylate-forming enzyme family protein [Solirubrobacterales bacterium]|nr:class I adenylate-forming enzyme family protein [Solirubrobacterales bacterium]
MEEHGIDRERATAEYHRDGWWDDQALADHVGRHARERPDAVAFAGPLGTLSWAGYETAANRIAGALRELGLGRGDRVGIMLPDGGAVHAAFLGCEKAGVVAVGVGNRAGEREAQHILAKGRATALITLDEHRGAPASEYFKTLQTKLELLRHHVVVPRFEHGVDAPIFRDGVETGPAPTDFPDRLGPDELWLINSTSGTTGLPKCVMHTQNRWWYFHQCAVEIGDLGDDEVFMAAIPAPFGFGQWTSHFTPAFLGAPTVSMERFDTSLALELIERERVTVLCAVSTQFRMLLADPALRERDLTSLRLMYTGGEMIPFEPARAFEELTGAAILNFYGSNESGLATATRLTDPTPLRLHTGGRVLPGTEMRLFDEDGADVTESRRGQPGTKGPATCIGYLDDPAANAELFTADGFLLHADIVELDEEGYLTVVGRTSDIVIRGGKNISAAQVEEEIAAHPRVALAAVVAMPDEIFGERVCAFVQLNDGGTMELAELTAFLEAAGASKEYLPERLEVVEEIPRSSGAKIAKGELRQIAAGLRAETR